MPQFSFQGGVFLLLLPFLLLGKEWHVDNGASGGTGSALEPFPDIQTALDVAQNGDQIIVAPGRYPTENNIGLELNNGLYQILITSWDEGVIINFGEERTPFLTTSNTPSPFSATISHFSFIGQEQGNIFTFENGELVVNDCFFSQNKVQDGHCLAVENTDLKIIDTFFSFNGWNSNGSTIYSINSNVSVINAQFSDNGASVDDTTSYGGALFLSDNNPPKMTKKTFNNCLFSKNFGSHGGAIYMENTQVLMTGSVVSDNIAHEEGGGLCISNSILTVQNSTLKNNNCLNEGGAVHLNMGNITITSNSQFLQNNASYGGGIYILSGDIVVSGDHLLSENTATFGGAIALSSEIQDYHLKSIHFASNKANYGGGVYANGLNQLNIEDIVSTGDNAAHGGFLWAEEISTFEIALSTISECQAKKGGSLWLKQINNVSLNKITVQHDKGEDAAITITECSGTIYRGTFEDNMGGSFSLFNTGTFTLDEPFFSFTDGSSYKTTGVAFRSEGLLSPSDIILVKNYDFSFDSDIKHQIGDTYFFYGKDTVFVTRILIPPMELHNSSVTRCLDYSLVTPFDNKVHLLDGSGMYIGGNGITLNKYVSSGIARILTAPEDEDLCYSGPSSFPANETERGGVVVSIESEFEAEDMIISQGISWRNKAWTKNGDINIFIYNGNFTWEGSDGMVLSKKTQIGDPDNHNFTLTLAGWNNNYFQFQRGVVIYGNMSLSPDSEIKFDFVDFEDHLVVKGMVNLEGTMSSSWSNQNISAGKETTLITWQGYTGTFNKQNQNYTNSSPPLSFSLSPTPTALLQYFFEQKGEEKEKGGMAAGVGLLLGLLLMSVLVVLGGMFFRKGGFGRSVEMV